MKYEIKHRKTGAVLYEGEHESMRECVEAAVMGSTDLSHADLSDADLRDANLRDAELRDADLSYADLSYADLRDANVRNVPVVPRLHQQILSALDGGGSLNMAEWHTCETTHCRAGWAVHLAGEAGKALEQKIGSYAAGAFITIASCPWMERVPDFYATNEDAMADIRRCAEEEKTK